MLRFADVHKCKYSETQVFRYSDTPRCGHSDRPTLKSSYIVIFQTLRSAGTKHTDTWTSKPCVRPPETSSRAASREAAPLAFRAPEDTRCLQDDTSIGLEGSFKDRKPIDTQVFLDPVGCFYTLPDGLGALTQDSQR